MQLMSIQKQIDNLAVSWQPQDEYIQQLSNLWDAHFDAESGNAELVDVQDAVQSMIEFLVDIPATDPDLFTVATRPGDRGLLHLVSARIRHHYPKDDWLFQGLDYVTSVLPLPIECEDEWRTYQNRTDTIPIFSGSTQEWQKPERRRTNFGDTMVLCVSNTIHLSLSEIIWRCTNGHW